MINNERQYRITKAALAELEESLSKFGIEEALVETSGDAILAKALVDSLTSEREVLSEQIKEYEMLKLGLIKTLHASSLSELPELLVKARISKGLSQKELASQLGLKEQQIQRYEAESYSSASLKRLIEVSDCLGLRISEQVRLEANDVKELRPKATGLEWANFPIKEMYRKSWFKNFTGSLKEAEANAESLINAFLSPVGMQPMNALNRQHVRSGSTYDRYSLLAWQYRVLSLAKDQNIEISFKRSVITDTWVKALVQLSSKSNGPALAVDYLKDTGIALIIEPHLRKTYLDGAAFWLSNGPPVIGMTLRYDRLDNFWFVLCHELAHLVLHLKKDDVEVCFDDLDASPDELEKQADDFAINALIANQEWEISLARYVRDVDTIKELASRLHISPSLVAGRIRKEAENYVILGDLVGAGEVRKQFPEVTFGL